MLNVMLWSIFERDQYKVYLCISFQVVSSAIVDKYIGESARLIREMFGKYGNNCSVYQCNALLQGGLLQRFVVRA